MVSNIIIIHVIVSACVAHAIFDHYRVSRNFSNTA